MKKKAYTETLLKQIGKNQGHSLVVSELLECLMAVWGGPKPFANAFFTEFKEARAGGVVRARMLSDIFRLFVVHTGNLKGTATPVEGMTDDELKDAIESLTNERNDESTPVT